MTEHSTDIIPLLLWLIVIVGGALLSLVIWVGKRHTQPFATLRAVIDGLFFWQKDHCESSYLSEVIRSQLPAEYRDKP